MGRGTSRRGSLISLISLISGGASFAAACAARKPVVTAPPPVRSLEPPRPAPVIYAPPGFRELYAAGFREYTGTRDPRMHRELAAWNVPGGAGTARPFLLADNVSLVARHRALLERAGTIEILWISQPVRDIAPLRDLGGVRRLWMESTVDDLAPLSSMPDLVQLYLMKGSKLREPGTLTAISRLETLAIGAHPGVDTETLTLEWAAALPQLRALHLLWAQRSVDGFRPLVLDELRRAERLADLILYDHDIADLSPLAALPNLASVRVSSGRIRAATGLAQTRAGFHLDLRYCQLSPEVLAALRHIDPRVAVTVVLDEPSGAP